MGNWRTVRIVGTCDGADVDALKKAIRYNWRDKTQQLHCLSFTAGMCGLPDWASEDIDVQGNLAERGFDEDDIVAELERLSKIAPSLSVIVHLGGDYESTNVVASIVLEDGVAEIQAAQISHLSSEVNEVQQTKNFLHQLMASNRRY